MKRLFWKKSGEWCKRKVYTANINGAEILVYWSKLNNRYDISINLFYGGVSHVHAGKQSLDATKSLARKLFQETLLAHKEVIDSIYMEYYVANTTESE